PVESDRAAAARRAVFADGLYFKMRPEAAERHSAQKVEELNLARAREEERERELKEGSQWLAKVWAGELVEDPDCHERVVEILRDMALFGSEAREYKWGLKLLEQAGLGADPTKPFPLLVKMGEMSSHENLDIIRAEIPVYFSEEILAEAHRLAEARSWENRQREDLTGLEIITADSGGARDFDDAISLEDLGDRLVLGVHIADVSSVVEPGTALDHEAMMRAISLYMPDRRIPMLPEILSEECLSLKAGETRPAFSLLVQLTESGEVLDYRFVHSLIRVKRQLSYQEVDAAVEQELYLGRLYRLSKTLGARRVSRGAMLLPLPKLNVYLTPEGEIGISLTYWENPGRSMISEFMILANHLAARFLTEKGAACLYRTQDAPSQRIMTGPDDYRELFFCLQQRRYLSRVSWSLEPQPHSGMGLDVYTNLTSPLRRYIDLLIQRQVSSLVSDQPSALTAARMTELMARLDETLRRAAKVQMNRRRYWLLRYMEALPTKTFEALVLERLPYRYRIFLPSLMLDADLAVSKDKDLESGQMITVRAKKIDAREDILKFELV
ncbi:MAG: RNB domain-containing ribonuclease, partial [Pseudomonadota bacterium]